MQSKDNDASLVVLAWDYMLQNLTSRSSAVSAASLGLLCLSRKLRDFIHVSSSPSCEESATSVRLFCPHIELAQDRDKWRTLVTAVMNLRVP
jgi:hypothetical protein